jgi:hypothetical protein
VDGEVPPSICGNYLVEHGNQICTGVDRAATKQLRSKAQPMDVSAVRRRQSRLGQSRVQALGEYNQSRLGFYVLLRDSRLQHCNCA